MERARDARNVAEATRRARAAEKKAEESGHRYEPRPQMTYDSHHVIPIPGLNGGAGGEGYGRGGRGRESVEIDERYGA